MLLPKKTTGLLQKQRPRKRRSFFGLVRRTAPIFLVLTVLALALFLGSKITHMSLFPSVADAQWTVQVQSNTLPAKLSVDVAKRAQEQLRGYLPSFSRIATNLRSNFGLAEVAIQRTGLTSASIRFSMRAAAFRIEGRTRTYLSADLGTFESDYVEGDQLPVLAGVASASARMDGEDFSVPRAAADAASKALAGLAAQKYSAKRYTWDAPRGISAVLTDFGVEVLMGLPPYEQKAERLSKILRDRSAEQGLPRRIELDFDGKAFIKEADPENGRM